MSNPSNKSGRSMKDALLKDRETREFIEAGKPHSENSTHSEKPLLETRRVTLKIPIDVYVALNQESTQRRIQRHRHCTLSDVASEVFSEWLIQRINSQATE